jgi:hypothetical protein
VVDVTLLFAHALLGAPPAVVEAAPEPRPQALEVGVGSGAFLPTAGPETMDRTAETGLAVGLRVGYFPVAWLGVEAEAVHFASRLGEEDVGGYAARGSLLAQVPARLSPFVLAGAGVLGRPTTAEPESTPSAHYGGGFRWYTHPNINLRVEARHLLAFGRDLTRQDVEATVGFGFTLFAVDEVERFAGARRRARRVARVR